MSRQVRIVLEDDSAEVEATIRTEGERGLTLAGEVVYDTRASIEEILADAVSTILLSRGSNSEKFVESVRRRIRSTPA